MVFAESLSLLQLLLLAGAAILAGVAGGMSGFGGGLILPPVLAPILGIKAVVPIVSVAMLMANGHRFWIYRSSVDRRILSITLFAAAPFTLLGTVVYTRLSADAIALMLGSFLILAIPLRRYCARQQLILGPGGLAVGASLFGMGSGTTTGMGMVLAPLLLGAGVVGPAFLATDAAVSTAINVIKILAFNDQALLTTSWLLIGLMLGACTLPGNYLGRFLVRKTSAQSHMRLMEAIIVLGGLSLLGPILWSFK